MTCTDIDECAAVPRRCDTNATCSNSQGSFSCTCKPGWSGSGTTCADVDECAGNTDNCDAAATCTNTQGGFTCACPAPLVGNGTACSCDLNGTFAALTQIDVSWKAVRAFGSRCHRAGHRHPVHLVAEAPAADTARPWK